jgi:hypothetical protein
MYLYCYAYALYFSTGTMVKTININWLFEIFSTININNKEATQLNINTLKINSPEPNNRPDFNVWDQQIYILDSIVIYSRTTNAINVKSCILIKYTIKFKNI